MFFHFVAMNDGLHAINVQAGTAEGSRYTQKTIDRTIFSFCAKSTKKLFLFPPET